ncbi:amino acid permease [bacterium]|nr:amino acid permease [bacterium]
MSRDGKSGFQKRLGLFDCTAVVMGSMIGSGIFIVSADMARALGSPGWLLLAWAVTGLLTVTAALCYGELAGMMPRTGGQYVYLREAYHPLAAFLYGWTSFLVIQCGTIAAVGMGFAKFTGVLFPVVTESTVWLQWKFIRLTPVHAVAVSMIVLLTWINTLGIVAGKRVQNAFTSSKTLIMAAFILAGLLAARNPEALRLNAEGFWKAASLTDRGPVPLSGLALLATFGTAMVGSLFSSDAWNNITFCSDEVVRPGRNIPLSLFLGTAAVAVLYLLMNVVYLQALPLRGDPAAAAAFDRGIQFAADDRVATAAIGGLLGDSAAVVMALFILISIFGCNNGIILSGSRIYYAMARDGLFFRPVGVLNRRGVPGRGLAVQGIWTCLLCLSGTYGDLLDYVVFAVLLFYILTIGAVFMLRRKRPDAPRPVKAFGYPVVPALYMAATALILADLLVFKPMYTWPGLVLVLLGIPVYFVWNRRRSASAPSEPANP